MAAVATDHARIRAGCPGMGSTPAGGSGCGSGSRSSRWSPAYGAARGPGIRTAWPESVEGVSEGSIPHLAGGPARIWHLAGVAPVGCRGFIGPVPPPLLIRALRLSGGCYAGWLETVKVGRPGDARCTAPQPRRLPGRRATFGATWYRVGQRDCGSRLLRTPLGPASRAAGRSVTIARAEESMPPMATTIPSRPAHPPRHPPAAFARRWVAPCP